MAKFKNPKFKEVPDTQVVGTVAELFAGVGGFRVALSRSNLKTVFSNQWEPSTKIQHASNCYVRNFGDSGHSNVDVAKLSRFSKDQELKVPVTDVLVGGFPCQDYSVAKSSNSALGLQGKKGVLWWEILRIVSETKPKIVFLENVDRLVKSPAKQRGRDFAVMLRTLGDLGYEIEWRIANAADYGFPQRRIRVFIVAVRKKSKASLTSLDAEKILLTEGILAKSLPVVKSKSADLFEFTLDADPSIVSSKFGLGLIKSPFLNSGVYRNGRVFTRKSEASFSGKKLTLGDVLVDESEIPKEYWVEAESLEDWKFLKGSKSIERTHKESGAAYTYAEGSMAFPDLLSNPSRTILTAEGGKTPSRFKHIIKIGGRYRRLVPRELERLSGFPDDWTRFGTNNEEINDSRRAFFIGNALVVGMVERVGKEIAKILKDWQN